MSSVSTDIDFDRHTPTPAPAARLVGRVACAVCGLRSDVLICKECAELPDARGMVLGWLDANTRQQEQAAAPWLALASEHADAWDRLRQAERTLSPDAFAARCDQHRTAGTIYGTLLEANERMEAAVQPLAMERARLERALSALEGI